MKMINSFNACIRNGTFCHLHVLNYTVCCSC